MVEIFKNRSLNLRFASVMYLIFEKFCRVTFFAAVGTILSALAVLWIYPATGYADDFVAFLEDITGNNSHLVTLIFGIIFPLMHSGLASLRYTSISI